MSFTKHYQAPNITDFMALRNKVGWQNPAQSVVTKSLESSLFHICIEIDNTLVGYGRVVGDGAMYFYLQDIVVDPDFQSAGIGKSLMQEIERYLSKQTTQGATVGLLAAHGKEAFYQQFGYQPRTGEPLGLGMCKFI